MYDQSKLSELRHEAVDPSFGSYDVGEEAGGCASEGVR